MAPPNPYVRPLYWLTASVAATAGATLEIILAQSAQRSNGTASVSSHFFPPAELAGPDGLVAIGGNLSPERLLDAYRHGIFPWPTTSEEPMLWWSPDPRAILPLDAMHISRRLQRTIRSGKFSVAFDTSFRKVIESCAVGPGRELGTWLTPEMIAAYVELHRRGIAHCAEVWQGSRLVGGVYGVAIGAAFAAESMFYRVRDASKAALVALVARLRERDYQLLDIQQWTPHTGSLGAVEIPRKEFLELLTNARSQHRTF